MHHIVRALCALSLTVSALTAGAAANPLAASAFSYAAQAPLGVRVVHRTITASGIEEEVTFTAPGGGEIHGEIIAPRHAPAPHAGVLFVHWLGDPPTTNLHEFEPDARVLAQHGITSLLVDAMWSQPHWFMRVRSTDTDYRDSVAQVVNLRRALDVLQTQAGVDSHRLAYVGHDFGAMYGAVLSGVDPRPRWYVLMAGTTTFSEWYLLGKKPVNVDAYVAQMAPLDPGAYLARSKADAYLFQFSLKDEYITPDKQLQFFGAAPLPKALYLYEADHSLRIPQAASDRLAWLLRRLTRQT